MKTTKFFMMAALALTFAACSNDDNDILSPVETQPAESKGIPFSATISVGENSSLRALTESGTTNYFNMASGLSLASKYYQSTVKLATESDVILSSGKCAMAGTSGAVAMIAYLGDGSDCTNGLAIQLNSSPEDKNWEDAKKYGDDLNTSNTIPGGTWRLPSKADWQNMFVGCAVSGDASSASIYMNPIAGFKAKIAATGTTWQSNYYWSSTASGSDVWFVGIDLDGSDACAVFDNAGPSYEESALGCLAF